MPLSKELSCEVVLKEFDGAQQRKHSLLPHKLRQRRKLSLNPFSDLHDPSCRDCVVLIVYFFPWDDHEVVRSKKNTSFGSRSQIRCQ